MEINAKQKTIFSNIMAENNIGTSTLTPLRVIEACDMGHRKTYNTDALLEGKMLLVAGISNKRLKNQKEDRELFRGLFSGMLNGFLEKLNRQGGEKMKTKGTLWINHVQISVVTGIMALGLLIAICVPQMSGTAHAQSYSSHSNWHHAMSNLAEKEVKEKSEKAYDAGELNVAANITDTGDKKGLENIVREIDKADKENETEN